jgi:hypothetical protein
MPGRIASLHTAYRWPATIASTPSARESAPLMRMLPGQMGLYTLTRPGAWVVDTVRGPVHIARRNTILNKDR